MDVFTLYVKKTVIRLAVGTVLGAVAAWAVGANEYISGGSSVAWSICCTS